MASLPAAADIKNRRSPITAVQPIEKMRGINSHLDNPDLRGCVTWRTVVVMAAGMPRGYRPRQHDMAQLLLARGPSNDHKITAFDLW